MNGQNGGQQNNSNKQNGLSWTSPKAPAAPTMPTAKPVAPAPTVKPAASFTPAAAVSSNASKITGWLAVGVVAGVVLAWGATSLMKNNTSITNSALQNATSTGNGTALGSDTSLTITSPQKAGYSVAIAKAVVTEPTWVVVYEGRGGKPGNVLGAAIFSADHNSGSVDLLRATVAGQSYFVTKHSDNGDRRFSLKSDPVVMVDGQPVWVTFTAN